MLSANGRWVVGVQSFVADQKGLKGELEIRARTTLFTRGEKRVIKRSLQGKKEKGGKDGRGRGRGWGGGEGVGGGT